MSQGRICPFVPVELKMSGGIRDFRLVIVQDCNGISKPPRIQLILPLKGSSEIPIISLVIVPDDAWAGDNSSESQTQCPDVSYDLTQMPGLVNQPPQQALSSKY